MSGLYVNCKKWGLTASWIWIVNGWDCMCWSYTSSIWKILTSWESSFVTNVVMGDGGNSIFFIAISENFEKKYWENFTKLLKA